VPLQASHLISTTSPFIMPRSSPTGATRAGRSGAGAVQVDAVRDLPPSAASCAARRGEKDRARNNLGKAHGPPNNSGCGTRPLPRHLAHRPG
jgi:hypothetical protein